MGPVQTGVLGCGTISEAYLGADDRFDVYDIVACADIDAERARETAEEYDLRAYAPDEMLADDDIELVVNLTPPSVHTETCHDILTAGKHVYVEKPLAASFEDAAAILDAAEAEGLSVGSAPDTFLGAGLQTVRSVVDDGRIGDPVGATAVWTSGGHESWHPSPDLYYRRGGGPLFDMGPYYVTALVSVLGPAKRVTGSTTRTSDQRTITSDPRRGETIDVEVPTHESGIVDFADGATASVLTSFDAPGRSTFGSPAFEIYGTDGTLRLPDPNHFEGPVHVHSADGTAEEVELTHEYTAGRGAGVADLAAAIRGDWRHRTSGALANHVLEILDGIRDASAEGTHVTIETSVERPEPLPPTFPDTLAD
ncbi:Gfo/Idh/MocA family protein [Halopelagius longus]|uniref:Gfo/Idh/MocA family oxidoreductase n=1 Tax=Halopelagius longus TaxID=1236180 RepID=A0A1H0XY34_9EURY|nr:Gfo/Idh/MocA family oxidoreductase [Halopelagius longus]RDI72154.1 gfo/Idh/MocA family oxidoreductase [Halopelagius longus]SDQ07586.1 Predicted dehydrogenase [Halopelagius longus]